jgi:serine/threonine-protein kinase
LREVGQPGDAYAAGGKAESATEENTLIDGGETGGRSQSRRHSDEDGARPGLSGRYSLGQKLGKGAMGIVYRARDTVLDRNVALKQLAFRLAEDDEYAVRFRQEAKALARLTHPNVVQVFDLIEDGGKLWMVLEFVSGGDLASYLKKSGRLSIDSAVSLVLAVAEGLAYAHGQGIVHRDLKPANILLTDDLIPKISDFGIAKLTQSSGLTEVGAVLGSPPYMSPEQCSGGAVDARADVYALGITLYELLSGKVPFEGDTASVLTRQIVESPIALSQLRADIPENLERVVHQMLAKKPEDRPENMATVKERLSPFREESIAEHRKSNDYHNKRVRPL